MSKPKRYTHISQINADIAECHTRSKILLLDAEGVKCESETFFKVAYNIMERAAAIKADETAPVAERIEAGKLRDAMRTEAGKLRESGNLKLAESDRLRLTATNLVEKKARKLGCKAAELQTEILPGIVPDKSIEK